MTISPATGPRSIKNLIQNQNNITDTNKTQGVPVIMKLKQLALWSNEFFAYFRHASELATGVL